MTVSLTSLIFVRMLLSRGSDLVAVPVRDSGGAKRFCSAAIGVLLAVTGQPTMPATLQGRVIHVVDGDTLVVRLEQKRITVRLVEIDAPEHGQGPYGLRSRQSLIAIGGGELASIDSKGRDRNGRVLARVTCNGTDANAEQVRRGMGWVFDHYSRSD